MFSFTEQFIFGDFPSEYKMSLLWSGTIALYISTLVYLINPLLMDIYFLSNVFS